MPFCPLHRIGYILPAGRRPAASKAAAAGLAAILPLCVAAAVAAAATLNVPARYPTILDAVIKAGSDDTILVAPGEYKLYFGNLVIMNKQLTLRSSHGAEQTTLIGRAGHPVITFAKGSRAVLQGFTITSTTDPEMVNVNGGGIYCASSSAPVIMDTVIVGNQAVFGGGIFCDVGSAPLIVRNSIMENRATVSGGGIFSFRSSAGIINNRLRANVAENSGGAMGTYRDSSRITNNFLWENQAKFGGGISCDRAASVLANNTITRNRADYGAGIVIESGSVRLTNLILWQNRGKDLFLRKTGPSTRPVYSDLEDRRFRGVNGNISADPLFVAPEESDFHLQTGSPCRDTGSLDPYYTDPDGSRNDMGGYGGPGKSWDRPKLPVRIDYHVPLQNKKN